jgi:site-specific recombinase XerD
MKMRDWKRALETADRWNKSLPDASPVVTVKEAVDAFVRHRQIRNMAESTIESHQKTFVHLVQFCGAKAINAVSLDMLTRFQESRIFTPNRKGSKPRAIQPSTINKELKTLRALFAFASKRKWCEGNVAKDLEPAEDDGLPTLPFESDEISHILEACDRLDDGNPTTRDLNRRRARARIVLMLHTGFRISDTVKLERKRVDLETGKLHIRIMKTRRPMYASLPASVIDALRALPDDSPYFFWSGKSKLRVLSAKRRSTEEKSVFFGGVENDIYVERQFCVCDHPESSGREIYSGYGLGADADEKLPTFGCAHLAQVFSDRGEPLHNGCNTHRKKVVSADILFTLPPFKNAPDVAVPLFASMSSWITNPPNFVPLDTYSLAYLLRR